MKSCDIDVNELKSDPETQLMRINDDKGKSKRLNSLLDYYDLCSYSRLMQQHNKLVNSNMFAYDGIEYQFVSLY